MIPKELNSFQLQTQSKCYQVQIFKLNQNEYNLLFFLFLMSIRIIIIWHQIMTEDGEQKLFEKNNKQQKNTNIVGYLTAGSLFKKDRKFTFQKNQKTLQIPTQQKISHRLTFNSEKLQTKYSQKPYLTERVRKSNNYFDDSFKITQFTNTQNTLFHDNNFTTNEEKDDSLSKYQHKIIQTHLRQPNFDRVKQYFSNKNQFSSPMKNLKISPEKSQKIPDLQASRKRYFSSCRQQAQKYLITLQTQLKQSQNNLKKVQIQVRNQIKQNVCQRSLQLKEIMIKMVDEFIEEWKTSEIQFYKVNEMKFLGDTKELAAQIEERQKLLQEFKDKLQFQQQQSWKKITAQLLYFDYDTTIKQIHKMSENIVNTVHQKYSQALNLKTQKQLQKGQPFKFQILQKAKKQLINIFINKDKKDTPLHSFNKEKENQENQKEKILNVSFGNYSQQKA